MRRHDSHTAPNRELQDLPGFRGCSARQLAQIDRLTDQSVVPVGRTLLREGMIGRELFVILSGTATVTKQGRVISTLGPGNYFGELAALDVGHRNATVTALTTLTVLIIGPRECATLMADIPGFRDTLLRGMARRLRAADDLIECLQGGAAVSPDSEFHLHPAYGRLSLALVQN